MPDTIPNAARTGPPPQLPQGGPQESRGAHRGWLILAVIIVLGVIIALALHHRSAAEASQRRQGAAPPAVAISTAKVRKGDIGVYVNALGAVTPVYTVMVKSRVDGQLIKVNYTEGQMVKEGDSLVEIDPQPYQATLVEAEGQLARDKALLENAHVDLERYQIAYASNAIPKQQYDTQVATVHQYEGTVTYDQGQVSNAAVQLAYCHITSPISGRVGLRLVDPGNIVHATDANPLAVIAQLQPITVVFNVAEDYLPEIQRQMRNGQKLEVDAFDRAQTKKIASGTLLAVDNQIDATTGTVKLKALFANEDFSLFPNQFVNARLLVSTEHNVTLVPTTAVQRNAQGPFVYVVQSEQTNQPAQTSKTVVMRTVTVGVNDGASTSVQGVSPGDVIAADNFNRLQDGIKVTLNQGGRGPRGGGGTNSPAPEKLEGM